MAPRKVSVVAALVRGEEDRIGESEEVVERLEPGAQRLGVFDAEGQPAHELVEDQSDDPASCPCEPMDSEDLLYLLYTSGTTAKPKVW